jgi:hypothetical protein
VLAYAESVSAVDHIVATYGRDALVALIRSYQTGVTDNEAFEAALGVDMAGFETDWLRSVGASEPVRHGPRPAPPGPVPEGWSGAAPVPSVEPAGSAGAATSAPTSPAPGGSTSGFPAVPIVLGLVVVAIAIGGLLVMRRRSVTPGVSPAGPGTWPVPPSRPDEPPVPPVPPDAPPAP